MDMTVAKDYRSNRIHPLKFALWLACGSMMMMFAGLTSAFVIRQAAGNWLEFELPALFTASTIVILISSVTLHASYINFKRGNERSYKGLLIVSFLLGMTFLALQFQGWTAMQEMGVPLRQNPSGDFVYVISWMHAAHVLAGLAILSVALIHAFGLKFEPTKARKVRFELSLTFWHFVDLLWLYLILFFTL